MPGFFVARSLPMSPTQVERILDRLDSIDADIKATRAEVHELRADLVAIQAGVKVGKWVVGLLIAIGGVVVGAAQVFTKR